MRHPPHFLCTSRFRDPTTLVPWPDPCDPCPPACDAPNEAYMLCPSRGDWWNDAKACGDAGPVGKKLVTGDAGGEVYDGMAYTRAEIYL